VTSPVTGTRCLYCETLVTATWEVGDASFTERVTDEKVATPVGLDDGSGIVWIDASKYGDFDAKQTFQKKDSRGLMSRAASFGVKREGCSAGPRRSRARSRGVNPGRDERVALLSIGRAKDPDVERADARLDARHRAVSRAFRSARDLDASAKRLLSDLKARGAEPSMLQALRAALAAHSDATRREHTVCERLFALEALERRGR
jgi:hypothetical protein